MGHDYDEKVFPVHMPSILQMIPLVLWWVLVQSGHREAQITSFVLRQKKRLSGGVLGDPTRQYSQN
jgi:hypothetical protein